MPLQGYLHSVDRSKTGKHVGTKMLRWLPERLGLVQSQMVRGEPCGMNTGRRICDHIFDSAINGGWANFIRRDSEILTC